MPFNYKKLLEPDKQRFGIGRIEALSDGVFAITMTLLILDIRLPHFTGSGDPKASQLLTLLPKLENYVISFLVLGLFWVRQQMHFKVIRQADRNLMWLNILFLMFVAIIPLSNSLLFEYNETPISIQLYCVNVFMLGLLMHWHWHYAITGHRLVDSSYRMSDLTRVRRVNLIFPLIFILTFVLSFINLRAAKFSLYFFPMLLTVSFKLYKRVKDKNDGNDLL